MRALRVLPALVVFLAASVVFGEVATKKFEWQPVNGEQDVEVSAGKIAVSHVSWDTGSTLKATPIRKSSAKVRIRLDNNGGQDEEVGVAVVVFDAEGNVVAAGSNGTKWGYLNKGDRTYYDIDFPYVYRRFDQATSFIVTIETKEKGSRRYKSSYSSSSSAASSPSSAPERSANSVEGNANAAPSGKVESEPLPNPKPQRN